MSEQDYTSFLEIEIARIKKRTRNTLILASILILVLIGYLSFVLTMAKTFTKPENAAFLVADNVRANFPSFMETTETLLTERSIILAESLSARFLTTVPALRVEAQRQLELAHTEMVPHLSLEFQTILADYIAANEESIELLAEQGSSQSLAESFVADIMQSFVRYLDASMIDQFDGRDLAFAQENSLFALKAMETYLDELMLSDPSQLDRQQLLEKRILTAVAQRIAHAK